ncbi:hypothetical protein PLICRDRAFT_48230 [Plicaturopsis crispa FD-325 SS-3]|nr:hypothetical protein PLICRDRAFT_48230 [Plicaturopsis crispa FD-325 SS-3]
MLLHWCTLRPSGSSNLAALRFSTPVRVQSIAIFPTGARPFSASLDTVAETEPSAFFLDVFLNAHAIHPASEAKPKSKPANALIPTTLAYTGGKTEFPLDLGPDFSTRLMIVKGNFACVSMAIYGETISDPSPLSTYEPIPIPSMEPTPLPASLDPANSPDPTALARQLLELIPDGHNLSLVIRLIFWLLADNEEAELPEFPAAYVDLDEELVDLDQAYHWTTKPVADDVSDDVIERFSERVANSIGPKDSNQSYLVAGILRNIAPQNPKLSRILMEKLDMKAIFDATNIDELTALRLLDATTNAEMARSLNDPWFLDMLDSITKDHSVEQGIKTAVQNVADRIRNWHIFEDALSNTQGDFDGSADLLKEIGTDGQFFGIWLESMTTHGDLVEKLAENAVVPTPQALPPVLFASTSHTAALSHDEFIRFVRAYIGTSSVLAVLAYADAISDDVCRERCLGVIRLWQETQGYREIINHTLLLRQITDRLYRIIVVDDKPRRSAVLAEEIVVNLAKEPRSFLRPVFQEAVLDLKSPLGRISDGEQQLMQRSALVADGGVSGAVEELVRPIERPTDAARIRTLRVALAIVARELEDEEIGEWRVLQALWKERSHGLLPQLNKIFIDVAEDLKDHFTLTPPSCISQDHVNQLFLAADELMHLATLLAPTFPLSGHTTRALTIAIADVFVCTDAADMLYSQESPTCTSAQGTRHSCIGLLRVLSECHPSIELRKPSSQVILGTLLEHALHSGSHDPAYHLLQVFCLVDLLLPAASPDSTPEPLPSHWIAVDIPNVLPQLTSFFAALDIGNKAHILKRLVNLDRGVTGVGEWLLLSELKGLSESLAKLGEASSDRRNLLEHHIYLSIRLLHDLITSLSGTISAWCITAVGSDIDMAETLTTCLLRLLDARVSSSYLEGVAMALAETNTVQPALRFACVMTILRVTQGSNRALESSFQITLKTLSECAQESPENSTRLLDEIGGVLSALAGPSSGLAELNTGSAEAIVAVLEWLSSQNDSVWKRLTISPDAYSAVVDRCRTLLDSERLNALTFELPEATDHPMDAPIHLPEHLDISIDVLFNALQPEIATPSTPKRKPVNDDILGLVTISPPTALLRSPAATGLTKTYSNNDFRQLRQTPSTRQNTSRLPSTHVDEFQLSDSSPQLDPEAIAADIFHIAPTFTL